MSEENQERRVVARDNVIYANFGAKKRIAPPEGSAPKVNVEKQLQAQQVPLDTASAFLRRAAEMLTDSGRLRRGREYAQDGHVLNPTFKQGVISADVAGSQNLPFQVSMSFAYRSADDLAKITAILAADPNGMTKARAGQLGAEIVRLLLADSPDEVRFRCNCPDHSSCCKHAVALAEVAASLIDGDAGLAFSLRGINLLQLEQAVVQQAKHESQAKATLSQESFWRGGELPDLPRPKKAPALDDSDLVLLNKAMRLVSYTSIDELKAVADIEDMYDFLTQE